MRYGSQTKEDVVSYLAVLTVDNDDLSLRPGMTATAEITTAKRENVLLVPNAALRFTPPAMPTPAREEEQRRPGRQPCRVRRPRPPQARERIRRQRAVRSRCMS